MSKRGDNLKEHQFKPGQSGNPAGRPKGTFSLVTLLKQKLQANGGADAEAIIQAAVDRAKEGDDKHFRMMLERIDGAVIQQIEANVQQNFKAIDKEAADDV